MSAANARVKRGAFAGGRRFAEARSGDAERAARLALGIRDLLAERGPMPSDELRERLCVASASRWRATVYGLARAGALQIGTQGLLRLREESVS